MFGFVEAATWNLIALYYRTLGKIMINCSFSVDNVRFGVKPVSKDLKSFPTNLVVQYIRNLNCGKTYKWGGSVEGRKRGGQDFISQPHLPPTETTFPFPTLSCTQHIHTHPRWPLVHSLLILHHMSHQESLSTALKPDEEFEKFWKIFAERLKIEVAKARKVEV